MRILITGSSGFIGQYVRRELEDEGYSVLSVRREVLLLGGWELDMLVENSDVIVNLAGASMWGILSEQKMVDITESRRVSVRNLCRSIQRASCPPKLIVAASSSAIYAKGEICDEYSGTFAEHFLGRVIRMWEREWHLPSNVRMVVLRLGCVVGKGMDMFRQIVLQGRLNVIRESCIFSIIHVKDVSGFIHFSIEHNDVRGIYNLVLPERVTRLCFLKQGHRKFISLYILFPLFRKLMGVVYYHFTALPEVVPLRFLGSGYRLRYATIADCCYAFRHKIKTRRSSRHVVANR